VRAARPVGGAGHHAGDRSQPAWPRSRPLAAEDALRGALRATRDRARLRDPETHLRPRPGALLHPHPQRRRHHLRGPRLRPPPRDHTRRCRMRIAGAACPEDGEYGKRPQKGHPNPAGSPRTPRETLPHGPVPTLARPRGNYGEVSESSTKQHWNNVKICRRIL